MNFNLQNRTQFFSIVLIACILLFSISNSFGQEVKTDDEEEFTQGEETTQVADTQDDPIKLFYEAQDAHAKGDYERALKLYEQAIKANPEFPEAEFQKGTIYQTLGKISDAERAYRRAIELRRDWTLPIAELGGLLVQKGEYIEAELHLNQAIRLNSMNFPAYVALTELKIRTNAANDDLKILLGKIQYLTTKAKTPASIWAGRAAIERKLNDLESANTSLQRALSIDDKNSYALEERIEIDLLESDTRSAVRNARNLSQLYPNSINAKLLLARSMHFDGKSAEAIKILDEIENPREDVVRLKTAIALNGNESIEELEKHLTKDENNAAILGRLCILSRIEQPEKALDYCQRASKLEPNDINHAIGFGAALVKLNRHLEAIDLFNRLLEKSPENYTIRANLATAFFQLNRFEDAKKEFVWITTKQPKVAAAYYFLAISHDRLEEYLDAMANYQQFLKLADDTLKLEVEKVNLRLPTLQRQIKQGKGRRR